jgi:uncharacterized protein (DUF58 family)
MFAPSMAQAATPTTSQTESAKKIEVDLELRNSKNKDASTTSSAVVEVGSEASFGLGDSGQVKMTIEPLDDGSLDVHLSMTRGGKTVVKAKSLKAAAGQTHQIKLGKGRTLSLKLSPKTHRIEMPEGNDPLSGL